MNPGRAAEEKEFLDIGHKVVGLANELAEKGMAFKLSQCLHLQHGYNCVHQVAKTEENMP